MVFRSIPVPKTMESWASAARLDFWPKTCIYATYRTPFIVDETPFQRLPPAALAGSVFVNVGLIRHFARHDRVARLLPRHRPTAVNHVDARGRAAFIAMSSALAGRVRESRDSATHASNFPAAKSCRWCVPLFDLQNSIAQAFNTASMTVWRPC